MGPFLGTGRARVEVDRFSLLVRVHLGRHLAVPRDRPPCDAVDEGSDPDLRAVRAVEDEEVAVLVEVPEQFASVLLEQNALADAVVVPHVVRGALVVPADLTAVHVHGDDAVGEQVVALADLSVEVGRRVAGAHVQQVRLRVEGAGDPGVRPAPCPGLAVGGPGLRAGLPGLGHRVAAPLVLAGFESERVEVAAYAELATGASDDDHALHDQRGERGALPGPDVPVGLVPDPLAGGGVERDHTSVRRDEEDLPLGHGDPAVHVPAAQGHVEGDRVLVPPDLHTRLGVKGPDPAVPAGEEHDPVDDDRGGLERVGRRARDQSGRAGLEDPGGDHALDVVRVDLVQRAVALPVVGAVVGQPVVGLLAGVEYALVVDTGHYRRRDVSTGGLVVQGSLIDSLTRVDVVGVVDGHFLHLLLLPTAAAVRDGRGEPPAERLPGPLWTRSAPGPRHCPWASRTSSNPDRRG